MMISNFAGMLLAALITLSPLVHANDWVTPIGAPHGVAGRVVIVDVFTYDCINCQHVVPELRHLYAHYSRRDLQILGIHTPELSYERVRSNVIKNLAAQGIVWPVAFDPDAQLWARYGRLVQIFVGEGYDRKLSALIRKLVAEH